MEFGYRLETDKPFDRVIAEVQRLCVENQFRVLAVHDVQATLEEKGFSRDPLVIIEMCNAGFAHEALKKDINVALFMPCKIAVHTESGKTIMTLGRPEMISQMMPEIGLDELASEVEKRLKKVMSEAVE